RIEALGLFVCRLAPALTEYDELRREEVPCQQLRKRKRYLRVAGACNDERRAADLAESHLQVPRRLTEEFPAQRGEARDRDARRGEEPRPELRVPDIRAE